MRRSDVYFYFLIVGALFSLLLTGYFIKNLHFWISDIKNCYSLMNKTTFFMYHFHIFIYIFSLPILVFMWIRTIFKGYVLVREYTKIKMLIHKKTLKKFKNIIILDTENLIAFNFGIKNIQIVLSKGLLKEKKDFKKSVYQHEKAHFSGKDSMKLFIISIISNLFPFPDYIKSKFSLLKEIEADESIKRNKIAYAQTLLNFYQKKYSFEIPMANGYIKDRIMFILENKKPETRKLIFIPAIFVFMFIVANLFKLCFCGAM